MKEIKGNKEEKILTTSYTTIRTDKKRTIYWNVIDAIIKLTSAITLFYFITINKTIDVGEGPISQVIGLIIVLIIILWSINDFTQTIGYEEEDEWEEERKEQGLGGE